jgi:hypothetical protein
MLYFLVCSVLANVLLLFSYVLVRNNNISLMRLNKSLNDELSGYKSAQSNMLAKISELTSLSEDNKEEILRLLSEVEVHKFEVDSKVKWLDRSGEEEFGIVCDDFFSENKHFVVVRGVKNGKVSGRYFTISAEKIVSE